MITWNGLEIYENQIFAILLCLVTVTACAKEDTKQNDASVTNASKTNDEKLYW